MITSLTSKSLTSLTGPEQRQQEYRSLIAIIVSKSDASFAAWNAPDFGAACGLSDRDLDDFEKLIPMTATTAHCILRQGVPSRSLAALSEYMGIGKSALADLVDLDRTTANRRMASDKPLPMHAAESVLRLLELNQLAEDTFESPEEAQAWLRRGHPMLGGESPLDWARTAYGAERVKEILIAAKYGGAV